MPPLLPLTARFRPKANVLVRELDGEAVLLDLDTGRYFTLNPTGRRIFELLDGEQTLAEVLELLLQEFDATRAKLEGDLLELVAELGREGLISTLE